MRSLIFDSILHCMQSTSASNPHLRLSEIERFIQNKGFIMKIIYLPTRHCLGFLFGWKSVHLGLNRDVDVRDCPKLSLDFSWFIAIRLLQKIRIFRSQTKALQNDLFPVVMRRTVFLRHKIDHYLHNTNYIKLTFYIRLDIISVRFCEYACLVLSDTASKLLSRKFSGVDRLSLTKTQKSGTFVYVTSSYPIY